MPSLADIIPHGEPVEGHRPWPRFIVTAEVWRYAVNEIAAGRATLLGLWGDASPEPTVHMAIMSEDAGDIAVVSVACPSGTFPSVGALHAPAIRLERAIRSLYGLEPVGAPDTRPWLDLGCLGRAASARRTHGGACGATRLPISAGGRREPAPDSCRSGTCRNHRAGTLSLHRRRRDRSAARTAVRLRAQGHRVADGRRDHRARGAACRARVRRQHRRLRHRLRPRGRSGAECRSAATRAIYTGADGGAGAAGEPSRRHRRYLQ